MVGRSVGRLVSWLVVRAERVFVERTEGAATRSPGFTVHTATRRRPISIPVHNDHDHDHDHVP